MTGDFVYDALIRELEDWKNNIDREKYALVYDYIDAIAYELGVSGDDTPCGIVDNLVVNGDFVREGDDAYERAIKTGEYRAKGDGIILL